jgi:hypothetical protein
MIVKQTVLSDLRFWVIDRPPGKEKQPIVVAFLSPGYLRAKTVFANFFF